MPTTAFAARTRMLSAFPSGLRSGLSLHPPPEAPGFRCCPSSLYTFPAEVSVQAWLGIAIAGFPEFGQFCIAGFPASTQVSLSPLRMPFRHARAEGYLHMSIIKQPSEIYTSVSGVRARGSGEF